MGRYANLHTHRLTDSNVLEIVNQYPEAFEDGIPHYSIGIHPWRIEGADIDAQLDLMEARLSDPNCVAIGECGLDKRIDTPLERQIEVFESQWLLAEKYRKPVIIHCVAAYQEVIGIKKRLGISVPSIIHGFSKSGQVADSLLQHGFYISFGKYLLRNPELATVFASIPDDRFFLETDTVDEAIEKVYEVAAKAKGIGIAGLQEIVRGNFARVFPELFP
ncbi:hydrolase TatD [Flavobacterium magnum]|uniref:Hydrolase TatD n=1 Tax=Flavobacterium magnum TaxID=2162713 RepID=A0A2S0RHG8_9FLAO|nr:TatD family hydrolase [Flavobacterium magnum]AWA30720.1 hydrolase TatD [Flavobacterium magnum]